MEVQRSKKTWLKNSPSSSQPKEICDSLDSGVGSFEEGEPSEGKDPAMASAVETLCPAELRGAQLQNGDGAAQRFQFVYLGFAVLDRRYTQSMLPWIISEVRRRKERQNVFLCVEESSVKALNVADGAMTFQHRVQTITRCARSMDKKCFAYLVKANDNTSSCNCYVFESVDNLSVPGFIHQIKETVKGSCDQPDGKAKRKISSFESTNSSSNSVDGTVIVNYPLTYIGRVSVSHRQAPPTLIDDSVQRFKNLNRRMELETELHGTNHHQIASRHHSQNVTKRQSPPELVRSTLHQRAKKAASLEGDAIIGECDPEALSKSDTTSNGEVRPRSASDGDKQKFNPSATKGHADSDHTSHQTHTKSSSIGANSENRNVILQISPLNVSVISSITSACLMEKSLREISFCQQGSKNPEHFGFICRDQRAAGYICYVFKGESENLVDSVMRSLKQAFNAAWQATGTTNVCEMCPLHHLHILCTHLEATQTVSQQHEILQKHMVQLADEEMNLFTDKYKNASPFADIQEEVEVIMAALRSIYEQRQSIHCHSHSNQIQQKDKAGSNLLQKAKKSLASSIENFRSKRGRSRTTLRDDIVEDSSSDDHSKPSPLIRHRSHTIDTLGHGPTPPMSPIEEKPPVSAIGTSSGRQKLQQQQGVVRNRSSESLPETFGSSSSPPRTPTKPTAQMHRRLSRQHSYRQNIFNSVVTPSKRNSVSTEMDTTISWSEMTGRKRSSQELRALWRKTILEQILLIRMDRENKTLDDIQKSVELKRLKLTYDGPSCSDLAAERWEKLLDSPPDVKIDKFLLQQAVRAGIPKARRGEVWIFLANQYTLQSAQDENPNWSKGTYGKMRDGHCSHQHSIFIDLGRTFPSHPFFMSQFGPGQLSLFNLLKAYSVQDKEVGYCQGLSFVAGILLMHMNESQAFDTMCHLMYDLNLRKLYKSDMQELQIQFYMLSRLLHDFHPELYSLLEELEITPTLYAAAWFLTLFASMFPVGFVVRIVDMIFLQGLSVVFKIMLVLFGRCKEEIMAADGFENVMEVIKTALPPYAIQNMESIVGEVLQMNVTKRLESYQIEYNVLREEDLSLASIEEFEHERANKLEMENNTLSRHLQELTEQLSSARNTIQGLEATINTMQINQTALLSHIRALKDENEALKNSTTADNKTNTSDRHKLTRSNSIETPDAPPLSPQEHSSLTDENTDSFEHLGCSDLTDDEAGSLDRDSPADELADKDRTHSPLLSDKTDDLAVSR